MKRITFLFILSFLMIMSSFSSEPLFLKQITDGNLSAKRISGMHPVAGTSDYAQIEADGTQIVTYSFKTGKKTGVLLNVADIKNKQLTKIDGYIISPNGKKMIIATNSHSIYRRSYTADFFVYDLLSKEIVPLSPNGHEQIPTFSPDGKLIAYVWENNIYITDGKNQTQVTTDGSFNEVINGLPDWVNEEEFSFNNALAWGADAQSVSWIRYDESKVRTYSLQLFKGEEPEQTEYQDYPGLYSYKYPKAGQQNSVVSAWTYSIHDGKTRRIALPLTKDSYIPRIKSTDDPNRILVMTMNRHQDSLCIYSANPHTGDCRLLINETNSRYVKEETLEGIIVSHNHIVLPSDRDGTMRLYLYDIQGNLLSCLTPEKEEVTDVYGYEEKNNMVYYQAVGETPMDRIVCKSNAVQRIMLCGANGWNNATFSGDYHYFLNCWSDCNHPFIYTIYNNRGQLVREVLNNKELEKQLAPYSLSQKKFFSFVTSEGVSLNGWMIKPSNFDKEKKYPVVMFQYGGPGNQQVVNSWNIGSMGNGGLFDYYLAQKGFIIVCVDGRGTGGRGAEFEKCTYLKLGEKESKDQVETALWLQKQSYVDSTRIGIWGWSFGGFNTLMSMSEGHPVFKAGVAVAPPTNWKYYDTIYTERYMRTPQENPAGYAINPITRSANLHGNLLICHGVADDNVHPQNTFEYAEALVQHDKDFKENYYTNRNHSIYGGNTRNHLLRQIAQWFEEKL